MAKDSHGSRQSIYEGPEPTDRGRRKRDNESHLIRDVTRRDRALWAAMHDRHVGAVFGLVDHLVGRDRAVAEDVNQEVWLLAIEQIDRFDPSRGGFRDWLLGIARRRALQPLSSLPVNNQLFRPSATGFIARSLAPLSISRSPASRGRC